MIRKMLPKDLPSILQIEEESFSSSWTLKQLKNELLKPISVSFVYEIENKVRGYVIAWDISGELEIGRIATHTQARKKGIGKKLLNYLFSSVSPQACFLEVSSKNINAIRFYESLLFKKISIRPHYYQDNSDAIIMKLTF